MLTAKTYNAHQNLQCQQTEPTMLTKAYDANKQNLQC